MTKEEFKAQAKEFEKRISELKDEISAINRVKFELQKDFANEHAPIKSGDLFDMPYGKATRRYRMEWVVLSYDKYEGQATYIKKDGTDGDTVKVYSWDYQKAVKV